jgi:hypothetical protein
MDGKGLWDQQATVQGNSRLIWMFIAIYIKGQQKPLR